MWMIADKGFLSVVAMDAAKADKFGPKMSNRHKKRLGKDPLLLRARVKADLEQVRPYFPKMIVFEMASSDYQWRAYVPRKAYAEFCYDAAMNIDYTSHFKEVVRDRSSKTEGRYEAMLGAWTALEKMQDRPAFSYTGTGGYYGSSTLCNARSFHMTETNVKVWDTYCSYKKDHTGKHSFEVASICYHKVHEFREGADGAQGRWYGKWQPESDYWSLCSTYGKPDPEPGSITWAMYPEYSKAPAKSTGSPNTAVKPVGTECAHKAHKIASDNKTWLGTYAADKTQGPWIACAPFGKKIAAEVAKAALADDGDDDWAPRVAGAADNDRLIGLLESLSSGKTIGEVGQRIDDVTPTVCWEIWAYADSMHGSETVLTAQEVADLVLACVYDSFLAEYKDEFLEALDEFGFYDPTTRPPDTEVVEAEVVEDEERFSLADVLSLIDDGVPQDVPGGENVPGGNPADQGETAAVAVNKEEVSP